MRDTERERQRHRQREMQVLHQESDAELDPRTPGSHPEPKADAQPLSHPGAPETGFENIFSRSVSCPSLQLVLVSSKDVTVAD